MSELLKNLETIFTILIACAAALAGVAGYLATNANDEASEASQNAQLYINEANTDWLGSNQYFIRDLDLLSQADIADFEGNPDTAEYLREMTLMFQQGYIYSDGTIPPGYADYEAAWDAYYTELMEPYNTNYDLAIVEFENASIAGERASIYLLSTVILAISATFGTVGLAIKSEKLKYVFLILVALFIAASLLMMVGA